MLDSREVVDLIYYNASQLRVTENSVDGCTRRVEISGQDAHSRSLDRLIPVRWREVFFVVSELYEGICVKKF